MRPKQGFCHWLIYYNNFTLAIVVWIQYIFNVCVWVICHCWIWAWTKGTECIYIYSYSIYRLFYVATMSMVGYTRMQAHARTRWIYIICVWSKYSQQPTAFPLFVGKWHVATANNSMNVWIPMHNYGFIGRDFFFSVVYLPLLNLLHCVVYREVKMSIRFFF